jgi:hypothetical protein
MDGLAGKGIDPGLLRERALLTPSCGTGSISEELAGRVLGLLAEVSSLHRAEA